MSLAEQTAKTIAQAMRYIEYVRDRHPEIHDQAQIWSKSSDGNVNPYEGRWDPETRNDNYRGD